MMLPLLEPASPLSERELLLAPCFLAAPGYQPVPKVLAAIHFPAMPVSIVLYSLMFPTYLRSPRMSQMALVAAMFAGAVVSGSTGCSGGINVCSGCTGAAGAGAATGGPTNTIAFDAL